MKQRKLAKTIEYYGVEIVLRGYNYQNNPDLKPSYANGTSHKYLYLNHKVKNRRFKTREEMESFMEEIKKNIDIYHSCIAKGCNVHCG